MEAKLVSKLKTRSRQLVLRLFFRDDHLEIVNEHSAICVAYGKESAGDSQAAHCAVDCLAIVDLVRYLAGARIGQAHHFVAGRHDVSHFAAICAPQLDNFDG